MNALKIKAYDLRQDVLDIIVSGGGGHIGGDSVIDELQALREDVRNLRLVVQLDSGVIAGGVYPHIDRRMETQRRREAARR